MVCSEKYFTRPATHQNSFCLWFISYLIKINVLVFILSNLFGLNVSIAISIFLLISHNVYIYKWSLIIESPHSLLKLILAYNLLISLFFFSLKRRRVRMSSTKATTRELQLSISACTYKLHAWFTWFRFELHLSFTIHQSHQILYVISVKLPLAMQFRIA